jgi:tetratricopeptide (TPR) repeat protein
MNSNAATEALLALKNGHYAAARDTLSALPQNHPLDMQYYLIRGLAEMGLADWPAVESTFHRATTYYPDQPELWSNLGHAQQKRGELPQAAASFERCLALNPAHAVAAGHLAELYRRQRRFVEAQSLAARAAIAHPDKAWALNLLGLVLNEQNKGEEAEKIYRAALALKPHDAAILYNLANNYVDQLNFPAAFPLFEEARRLADSSLMRRGEAQARLLAGDFEKGWPLYEARLDLTGLEGIPPTLPRYQGQDLRGKKLLLTCEQGFGDVIQFCRFSKRVEQTGAELIWRVQKPLQRLLSANLPGKICVLGEPLPEADYYLPILSIPLAFHALQPKDWPRAPYLTVPLDKPLLPATSKHKKIGLVWTGSPTHGKDHQRRIPLDCFAPLLARPDTQFYAPFIGEGLTQIVDQPITRLDHLIHDFADTAVLLQQLDSLITTDTSVAHLAGALGIKTYLLLAHCPDWRWGSKGFTTPWYESVTLLRQEKPGDWAGVVEKLSVILENSGCVSSPDLSRIS